MPTFLGNSLEQSEMLLSSEIWLTKTSASYEENMNNLFQKHGFWVNLLKAFQVDYTEG